MSTLRRHVVCWMAGAAAMSVPAALPSAHAAPAVDAHGYVDSTARCTPPSHVVVFGSTATSRVAICESSDGRYEYRGVRVRDGATLIAAAAEDDDGGFVVDNNGITYTLTPAELVISTGTRIIREEPMVDFHRSQTPDPDPAPSTPLPPPLPAEVGHTDN
ncbi:hypothetical protein [Mycolicibacterium sp. XJ1819]